MPDEASTNEAAETPDLTNKSVVKATMLLSELGRHLEGITVTELAQRVGMTRPTAFRLLLSLEQTGFVERSDNKYTLGWEIARLGRLADPHQGIISRVQATLDALAGQLNETVSYAVVNGETDFDVIAEASGSRLLSVTHEYVGQRFPLHASATGKLLLAELPEDRVEALLPETLPALTRFTITDRGRFIEDLREVAIQGYATLDNELEEGLFSVAVPVRDEEGRLIGVLTVNGPDQRMKSGRLPRIVERLRQVAEDISKTLTQGAPVPA